MQGARVVTSTGRFQIPARHGLDARQLLALVEAIHRFDRLLDTLNQGIALKRKVVAGLRPPLLSELGLIEALRALPDSGDIGEHGGRLEIDLPDDLPDVPAQTALALYRIAQEALTNVRRHAHARCVDIELRRGDEELIVTISDDGVGLREAERIGATDAVAAATGAGDDGNLAIKAELIEGKAHIMLLSGKCLAGVSLR